MKLPNTEEFNFKECEIGGDTCWLITPTDMSTKWFDDNARFRSCIVRQSDNFVISQSFSKFTNWGERPEFQPWNPSWKLTTIRKIDGSCLIVSRYKGEWIIRTRGTSDARQLDNGHEINLLMKKYSRFFDDPHMQDYIESINQTWLFEWTTPTNVIVIRETTEPNLSLIGIVLNENASYYPQSFVDSWASELGFDRPEKYEYASVSECIADVLGWQGKEGVVIYSPDGQTLKKIKASQYLELHKIATGIKNINQIVELFMVSPKFTDSKEFYKYIETALDFEIAEKCKDFIEQVCESYKKVVDKIKLIDSTIEYVKGNYGSRKDQAIYITDVFDGWEVSYAFCKLDGKIIEDKLIKKAIEQGLID